MPNPGLTQWPPVWAHQGRLLLSWVTTAVTGGYYGPENTGQQGQGICEELVQRGVPSSDTLLRPLLLSPTEKPRPDTSAIYIFIYNIYII